MRLGKHLLLAAILCTIAATTACRRHHLVTVTELCFRGTVTATGTNTVTFNGFTFHTDAGTVYFVNSGATGTAADLAVGSYAVFDAVRQSDNSLLVTKAQVVNDTSPDLEAAGTITALSATSVTINGIPWVINGATTFAKAGGAVGAITDFVVGQQAQIEGPYNTDTGVFTATDMITDVESCDVGHAGV